MQRIHSRHFINLKDYTFSSIPESSLSKMYYLLHPHLNFNTHQFISRNNTREDRNDIYQVMLFTTRKKTEELSYSALPIGSLSRYSLRSRLSSRFWLHVQIKLLSTVLLRLAVRVSSYFRDTFYTFLVLLCLACFTRQQTF